MTNTPIQLPLPLPRFTFLCGPPSSLAARYALTEALCKRDPHLLFDDFEEPLRHATMSLFFGGMTIEHDLTNPKQREALLPISKDATVENWLADQRHLLEEQCGNAALAELAIRDYLEDGAAMVYDRFIWRDADPLNVNAFVDRFGRDDCLAIHLSVGTTILRFDNLRHIPLLTNTVEGQLIEIETALTLS